jgi:threonyl-tRNA synthetase
MPDVRLPDGSHRSFAKPVTLAEVAQAISPGLARVALAAKLDGRLVDLSRHLTHDASVEIITETSPEGVAVLRHSTAHLLAHAVKELFPEAQVTIGPVIEHGFYYDFSYQRPFTPDDLVAMEKRMGEIAKRDLPIVRRVVPRDEAIAYFQSIGERYKAEIIGAIPAGEEVSLYSQGEFTDLCRGPHVPATGRLKVFKLMKLAGAYWRGDSRNEMLQRVYGTAWAKKQELDAYVTRLEEAEKRDHRRVGRQLDLYHFQDDAPGMVFWHPKGWRVWQQVEQYMRRTLEANGYVEVRTPQVLERGFWERSGHWQMYAEHMFTTQSESREYAIKPMNCPGHIQIFNQGLKSYRELPLRLAEFGACHRNEPSGALHGMMRVRGFTQDDAHIFCAEDQVQDEAARFIDLLQAIYADFGFTDILVKLSTRPEKRVGTDDVWDRAEAALDAALHARGISFAVQPGEGAFYGPKIEFSLRDSLERVWQCGTLQLDFFLPERLGASYVAADNSRRIPVMLHRAILGSLERFIGILVENHAGALPPWLAPVQVVVSSIAEGQADYAASVAESLRDGGFRAIADLRGEKINLKIREHSLQKLPYQLIVGDKEKSAGLVAVRTRQGTDLGQMGLSEFSARLRSDVARLSRPAE